uniref:Uncharacterized protein n=1 Tax=Anguilla anguilla TaxID=7936 RepID=A0A0E9QPZ1_ANGAN
MGFYSGGLIYGDSSTFRPGALIKTLILA